MPAWLLWVLESLGVPLLKAVAIFCLKRLESVFPGAAALFEAIIAYLNGGASASKLHEHLASTVPGFPVPPKAS